MKASSAARAEGTLRSLRAPRPEAPEAPPSQAEPVLPDPTAPPSQAGVRPSRPFPWEHWSQVSLRTDRAHSREGGVNVRFCDSLLSVWQGVDPCPLSVTSPQAPSVSSLTTSSLCPQPQAQGPAPRRAGLMGTVESWSRSHLIGD